jgi:cobalt-zinc-cadmium efflux system outer membrane protein
MLHTHKSFSTRAGIARKATLSIGFACALSFAGGDVAQAQSRLSLHQAIQLAQDSPAARIGKSEVDAMQGVVKQAGLRPNPRLFVQSEDIRPWASDYTFSQNTEDYAYVSQTLETDGKRWNRVHLARARLNQTEAQRILQLQQLDRHVAASYWNATSTARISELMQQDLSAVDEVIRYQQERVDAGAMRGVDLVRMQMERDRLSMALEAARREAQTARVELARQIGREFPDNIELTDSLESIDQVPKQALEEVMARRADVTMAHQVVAAAEADLKLQKSMGVPDVDVVGGMKRNLTDNTLYLGVQVPLPLWNKNQGETQRAKASLQTAQEQLEQMVFAVKQDVTSATATYDQELRTIQTTLPEARERARQNLSIMRDAYVSGGVDLVRYLDAERTEIEVEAGAFRALAAFHLAVVQLELAYGVEP